MDRVSLFAGLETRETSLASNPELDAIRYPKRHQRAIRPSAQVCFNQHPNRASGS